MLVGVATQEGASGVSSSRTSGCAASWRAATSRAASWLRPAGSTRPSATSTRRLRAGRSRWTCSVATTASCSAVLRRLRRDAASQRRQSRSRTASSSSSLTESAALREQRPWSLLACGVGPLFGVGLAELRFLRSRKGRERPRLLRFSDASPRSDKVSCNSTSAASQDKRVPCRSVFRRFHSFQVSSRQGCAKGGRAGIFLASSGLSKCRDRAASTASRIKGSRTSRK
mmetsp:Transcript_88771/g.259440  ORF Transcript_88771/g.259440 Transcript_88771/m.259440 type:complete len:228 (+) Transcript_88771:709-1392(+)